jgi:hypothetical protein
MVLQALDPGPLSNPSHRGIPMNQVTRVNIIDSSPCEAPIAISSPTSPILLATRHGRRIEAVDAGEFWLIRETDPGRNLIRESTQTWGHPGDCYDDWHGNAPVDFEPWIAFCWRTEAA